MKDNGDGLIVDTEGPPTRTSVPRFFDLFVQFQLYDYSSEDSSEKCDQIHDICNTVSVH